MSRRWIMSLAMSVGVIGLWCAGLWCAPVSAAQSLPLPPSVGPLVHYVAEVTRSCQNAAYSLWSNNDYSRYRQRQSPPLSIHYHPGLVVHARPAIPDELPEPLRAEFAASIDGATELLRLSALTFKDLADYVAAKDFEADQYRKGDELNAKLVALGQKCFRWPRTCGPSIARRRNSSLGVSTFSTRWSGGWGMTGCRPWLLPTSLPRGRRPISAGSARSSIN